MTKAITSVWVFICVFIWPLVAFGFTSRNPLSFVDASDYGRMPLIRYLDISIWLYPISVLLGLLGCYLVHCAVGKIPIGLILSWLPLLHIAWIFFVLFGIASVY